MHIQSPKCQRVIFRAVPLAIMTLSSAAQAASPFTTEGKFSVGSDGSANYSIPIVVPPGTAGMQPQLALNYNSNGGNGIVGMGWGIDGLSQISRCPTTLEQDGVINGVTYTNTDRFCIDGQRLIATSDTYNTTTKQYSTTSAYGANGTEYRTESANFAKIISYGQAGNGPAYFKVWTKSGQIIEYGNTADSAIEAQGKPTIRTWGVNKISDTKGNYITVTYTEDNANGEAYVSRIDYTGNASSSPALTPYASVQFVYESRPDITTAYQAGSVLKTTKRLTNIQTYTGTTQVKNYKLTYEQSQSTNRSRLKTAQECDGGSGMSCKSQTTVTSSDQNFNSSAGLEWANNNNWAGEGWWGFNDFNGDGLPDLWFVNPNSSRVMVRLSTGSGFDAATEWANNNNWAGTTPNWKGFLDFNQDGKDDLWFVNPSSSRVMVRLSTGNGFGAETEWANNNNWAGEGWWGFNDFNGDGLPDLWFVNPNSSRVLVKASLVSKIDSAYFISNPMSNIGLSYTPITNSLVYVRDNVDMSDTNIASPLPRGANLKTNSYPIKNLQGPMYVVSSTSVSDGIGGVVTTNYQYGGLKAHLRGRGSLGFRYVKESSPDSGLSVTTFYRQDFPFIGLPSQVEKRRLSDNALLSVVQNTYTNTDLATGTMLSKFPYLSQSVEQAYELDGSLVSTTTTTNQYDGYGNVTSVKVDDGVGNTKTTTSTYNNDVGNWLLGRLIRSVVTSVSP